MHYRNIMFTSTGLGFLVGLTVGASACVTFSERNLDHCAQQNGDEACMEKFGDARPYCMMCGDGAYHNDGCVEKEPSDLECYSPCGGMQSHGENSSCVDLGEEGGDGDGDGDGGGDGDGDGESTGCKGPEDCQDPATPFCDLDSGECIGCEEGLDGDAACDQLSGGSTPVCVGGMCMQCNADNVTVCTGTTPFCDYTSNTCVGCREHDQCPDSACNLQAGNCMDPANIEHVDGHESCNTGDGSEDTPYCSIAEALANSGDEVLIMLHENDSDEPYLQQITISKAVAVFATNKDISVQGTGTNPAFSVDSSGALFLRGFHVAGAEVEGIRLNGGSAWVQQMRVVDNTGGGIVVHGGTLLVENSFVSGAADSPALSVLDGTFELRYVSVGLPAVVAGPALRCTNGAASRVRNSLITSTHGDQEIECPNLTVETSALEMSLGDNNVILEDFDVDWFDGYLTGDFHLSGMHPDGIAMAAIWTTGDPMEDIEGDTRQTDSPDFAGADVPD
jgi:hypothetical protein